MNLTTFHKKSILGVAIIGAIVFWLLPDKYLDDLSSFALLATLWVIYLYAHDTHIIAKTSELQLESMESPCLVVLLGTVYEALAGSQPKDIKTDIIVTNPRRLNMKARIYVVFKYDSKVLLHKDPFYSGKEEWLIGGEMQTTGNFSILDLISETKTEVHNFTDAMLLGSLKYQFEVAIFSLFKIDDKRIREYSLNQPRYYYIDAIKDRQGIKVLRWVAIPKSPPEEMKSLIDQY